MNSNAVTIYKQHSTGPLHIYVSAPVLLVGSAGTGKNHLVKQVAGAVELELCFASSVKQEHQLLGFIDAYGNYDVGPHSQTLGYIGF